MELELLVLRIHCFCICLCEILLVTTAESLGGPELQFPPKLNHHLRPERKPSGRNLRSEDADMALLRTNFSVDEDSLKESKMLEFIDSIRNNQSAREKLCNKSRNLQTITLSDFNYEFKPTSFQKYNEQVQRGRLIAKYLTDLFTNNPTVEFTNFSDEHVPALISFLRIIIDDGNIAGAGIAFSTKFFPYIYKNTSDGDSMTQDFGMSYKNFTNQEFYAYHSKKFHKSYDVTSAHTPFTVHWEQPYFDCFRLKRWVAGVSLPFFNNATKREFKGVVLLDIDLNKTAINQCEESTTLFAGSHKCRPESTKCMYSHDENFGGGNYECHCKSGFYFPILNATQKHYSGTQLERHILSVMRSGANFSESMSEFQCLPCHQRCVDCEDEGPCFVEYNIFMRGIPLGIQSFCMTISLVLGIVVLRVRKCKVMVIGMWCLLEIILLGALLLYATVVVQYFEPSTTTCLLVPWLRELGFAILYGALVLKIYRLLADFQSRKAHRVHVRDKDLLKYLLCIVMVVIGYMAAWTCVNIDQVQEGSSLLETGEHEGLRYIVCKDGWWDYSTESAEILFLVFGLYLCWRVRAAQSEYREGFYVSTAIFQECVISTMFYALRHIYWVNLHPDYLFLMYFLRCQLTVSVTLVLVFGPKLWYAHRPPDERSIRNRAYSASEVPDNMAPEAMKLNVGISSNGDVDVGDVSLADMDPEDIRLELKRLYTQLQVYKTRNMRKDNPHISKRRGGRKQTHRRFSLQAAFHHKHRHHHDHEHEHELSKTPEESTNSAEGLPMPIEMSVTKCEDLNEVKPTSTVSFKMSHTHK
ncbi:probable G-protein coupled receptor 158 [Mya arenaria]|uniref:probable G-protein coupled receptor 158 n=1 Tax=Mya arenaria TaxID=6604 RepID=UPI0022E010B5|nr:probable G-protein coupled receptor 158 [Mya arenaria]XP_052813725.1 probable G-protein coupled receptor 158 [Mya arenaria]XP_052813726.1 probable G-protein coupled receptor 158 [Mya arenaria]XP_052813727.1 probable G-protein coupled receptor 158 [Mya arenaria]